METLEQLRAREQEMETARRWRLDLLHDHESTRLSRANFCALKNVPEAQLEASRPAANSANSRCWPRRARSVRRSRRARTLRHAGGLRHARARPRPASPASRANAEISERHAAPGRPASRTTQRGEQEGAQTLSWRPSTLKLFK